MIPITRKELYLNKIVGNNDYDIPEKPITEEEFFFAEILGEAVQAPEPLTRYQMFLAKIAGRDIEIPYPETRLEYFLARAAGMDIETPTPITKEEIFWSNYTAIVEFEIEGVPPLTYKAIEGTLKNYRIYGQTIDDESVGDKTRNLYNELYTSGIPLTNNVNYEPLYVGDGTFTCSSNIPKTSEISTNLFFLSGNVNTGASSANNGVSNGVSRTVQSTDGYVTLGYRGYNDVSPADYHVMINSGSSPLPYEPYGCKVPVTVSNGTDTLTTPIYLPYQIRKVGDDAEYIDYGEQKQHRVRKNLLQNTATSRTINGVTFTVNADGSVTCNTDENGATANTFLYMPTKFLSNTNYILSGCPIGGGTYTYRLDIRENENKTVVIDSNNNYIIDSGAGCTFSLRDTIELAYVTIRIVQNYVCTNLTFYPMIRKADIEDDTYEPYIENTDLDVTLPALPTVTGTNALSVGTEVQPSKVYIQGEKEREY